MLTANIETRYTISMNTLRTFLIGLAGIVCVTAISGFVYLLTLQNTVMDRAVVKEWLSESKIYDGRLLSAFVQTSSTNDTQGSTSQQPNVIAPSPDMVENILAATFTPDFTQTHIESLVDNTYDWIEGTTPTFAFSIPINQKRDAFIQELAKALEPQVAALPVCRPPFSAQGSTCRPANISPAQLAVQLSEQSVNESGFLDQPLTNQSFTSNSASTSQPPSNSTLTQMPAIKQIIDLLLVILPVVVAVSAVVIILGNKGRRLQASSRFSQRVFFSMLFTLIPAIVIVFILKDNDFGLSNIFTTQIAELIVPLIKTTILAIAYSLALFSGITAAIGLMSWIILSVIQHNMRKNAILSVVTPTAPTPTQPLPQQGDLKENQPLNTPRE